MKLTLEFFKMSEVLPQMGDRIVCLGRGPGCERDWGISGMIIDMPHKLEYLIQDRNEPYRKYWVHIPIDSIIEQDPDCPSQILKTSEDNNEPQV